LQLELNPGLLN